MPKPSVRYLVFDVESVADAALVARLKYPGENIDPNEAVTRYRAELMKKNDSDFIPYTFQVPISIVVAKVAADFRLIDLVALDEPQFRSHVMTDNFWKGWDAYRKKSPLTIVSFNGRTFDVPLLELAAFRFGLPLPGWFNNSGKTYEQPRNRYNAEAHLDLQDVLTNFGASRFSGGLNLAANLLGKPGKMDVQGYMVQDLYNEGRLAEINDYCRCDVLDTYFVFLRCHVVLGQLKLEEEQKIIAETKAWLQERSAVTPVYAEYLSRWGTWRNPWEVEAPTTSASACVGSPWRANRDGDRVVIPVVEFAMPGKTFTLRSWFVALTIFLLLMGWATDHFYFQRDAQVLMLTKQLQREVDSANAATNWGEYERAVTAGVRIMQRLHKLKEKSAIAMPVYAAALRVPKKYDIDYSLPAEAEAGLAAIGRDAIPFVIGLMSDEDPQVREHARDAARLMINQERTHYLIFSLPPEEAKNLERRIKELRLP